MGRRLAIAAVFFVVVGVATGVLGRTLPPLLGPLSALALGALGALLIALAPRTHGAAAERYTPTPPEPVLAPITAMPQMAQLHDVVTAPGAAVELSVAAQESGEGAAKRE